MECIDDSLTQIVWLLLQPRNLIPLLFAFAIGFVFSTSKFLCVRKHEKKWYVYTCNVVVAIISFAALNYDSLIDTLLASMMLVAAASILLPAVYFKFGEAFIMHKLNEH